MTSELYMFTRAVMLTFHEGHMKILVIGIFIVLVYFLELLFNCIFLGYASIIGTLKINLVNSSTL